MKAPQMTTSLTSSICKAFFSAVTLIVFSVYLLCVTIPSLVKVDNTVMADNKSLHRESAATSDGGSFDPPNSFRNTTFMGARFEITGRVQHVHFRMYTEAKATELGLTGWCRNTRYGTVEGEYECYTPGHGDGGPVNNDGNSQYCRHHCKCSSTIEEFRNWLCHIGSDKSRIDNCTFTEEVTSASSRRFENFVIIKHTMLEGTFNYETYMGSHQTDRDSK